MARLVLRKSKTFSGYKLQGHIKYQGLNISIENERGTMRRGEDADGHEWSTFMHVPYGYIRLTEGVDGDHVDCYIGDSPFAGQVYIVHQNDPTTGKYDEDKCMIGFDSAKEAKAAYIRQYDRPGFFGTMDIVNMDEFKTMLKRRYGLKLKKSLFLNRIPKRVMVTHPKTGKKYMAIRWVSSGKKKKKDEETTLHTIPDFKSSEMRHTFSSVSTLQDMRDIIDYAPDSSRLVDKVLAYQQATYPEGYKPDVDEVLDMARKELTYGLSQKDSGVEWYDETMSKTRAILTQNYPEFADDTEWDFFLTFASIASAGNKPLANLRMAIGMYEVFKETGTVPLLNPNTGKVWSVSTAPERFSKKTGKREHVYAPIEKFNDLYAKLGSKEKFVEFMNSTTTIGDLRRDYGDFNLDVRGARDEVAFNSMLFGEKVGQFYHSMRGTENAVTVDMWIMRSFYRWTGDLKTETNKGRTDIYIKISAEIRKTIEYMFATLGSEFNLEARQVQAVLWYYEKRLYKKLGVNPPMIGGTDFAGAAEQAFEAKHMRKFKKSLDDVLKCSRNDIVGVMENLLETGRMPSFPQFLRAILKIKRVQKSLRLVVRLDKAKKMAIGTVSRGRKKVAEGKWIPVPKGVEVGPKIKLSVGSSKGFKIGQFVEAGSVKGKIVDILELKGNKYYQVSREGTTIKDLVPVATMQASVDMHQKNKEFRERQKQEAENRESAERTRDDMRGFLDSMNPMQAGKAKKHLLGRSTVYKGELYRHKEFAEKLIENGFTETGEYKGKPTVVRGKTSIDVSQTIAKYIKHLLQVGPLKKSKDTKVNPDDPDFFGIDDRELYKDIYGTKKKKLKKKLKKGRALPEGTISTHGGKKVQKKQGKWIPVHEQRKPKVKDISKVVAAEEKWIMDKTGNHWEAVSMIASDGIVIGRKEGSKDAVNLGDFAEQIKGKGITLTHNHPNDSSFSFADISFALKMQMQSIRAISNKHTYQIDIDVEKLKRLANLQRSPYDSYVPAVAEGAYSQADNAISDVLWPKVDSGELTPETANEIHFSECNPLFVKIFSETFPDVLTYTRRTLGSLMKAKYTRRWKKGDKWYYEYSKPKRLESSYVVDPGGIAESLDTVTREVDKRKQSYAKKLSKLPFGTSFKAGRHVWTLTDLAGDRIWLRDDNVTGLADISLLTEFGAKIVDKLLSKRLIVKARSL